MNDDAKDAEYTGLAWGLNTRSTEYTRQWDRRSEERISFISEPNIFLDVDGITGKLKGSLEFKKQSDFLPSPDKCNGGTMFVELEVKTGKGDSPHSYKIIRLEDCHLNVQDITTKLNPLKQRRIDISFKKYMTANWVRSMFNGHLSDYWATVLRETPKQFDLQRMDSGEHGDFRGYHMRGMHWQRYTVQAGQSHQNNR